MHKSRSLPGVLERRPLAAAVQQRTSICIARALSDLLVCRHRGLCIARALVIFCLANQLYSAPVSGQDTSSVGRITRIADGRGSYLDETTDAQVRRSALTWNAARRNEPLYDQNLIRLLRNQVYVDLDLTDLRAVLGSRHLSTVGTYLIRADAEAPIETLSNLEIVVQQGTLIVSDVKKVIRVVAAGTRVRIFGTTVLFDVDESGESGTLFLRDGSIDFPDFGTSESGESRVWQLRSGQPPVELFPPGDLLRQFQRETKYSTESVWTSRPVWQQLSIKNPLIAVPLGIGLGVVGLSIITPPDDGIAPPPPRPDGG